MQVMDAAGGPEPLAPELIETDELVGVRIADRVVLFSREARRLAEPVSFVVPGEGGDLGILVTGMAAGRWRAAGPVAPDLRATEEGGALYFRGPVGAYQLVPAG